MRTVFLSKNGINKLRARHGELKVNDVETSIKSISPGEWCLFKGAGEDYWVGFVNPLVDEKFSCIYILSQIEKCDADKFSVEDFMVNKIRNALEKRFMFLGYEKNSRIFYGGSDGLPGLIVDQFENAIIIQINTAGVDKYRELVRKTFENHLKISAYFLDNQKYREKEFLPTYNQSTLPDIHVVENELKYFIRSEVLQKVGFYYDHRENRFQLMSIISRLRVKLQKGLDLFSYAGAWGMCALKAGIDTVDFVDQGDFSADVEMSLSLNKMDGRGQFFRKDVFKFLDESFQNKIKYNAIFCDPPAFAKSSGQKNQALEGYTKLHRKVFKILSPKSLVVFSSCTHYVDHEEFQKNILDAAVKENRNIQLIYSGMQGYDHPVASLTDRSNYIKSYIYIVE